MLVVGDYNCLPIVNGNIYGFDVWNLSSPMEGFKKIHLLPPTNLNYFDEKTFDISYMNYIMNNNDVFAQLMSIIYDLYKGINVYLIVHRNEFYDMVTESLLKLIQQRYGYISSFINTLEDLDYVNKDSSFSIQGLYNLDQDKERLSLLVAPTMMDSNGEINGAF